MKQLTSPGSAAFIDQQAQQKNQYLIIRKTSQKQFSPARDSGPDQLEATPNRINMQSHQQAQIIKWNLENYLQCKKRCGQYGKSAQRTINPTDEDLASLVYENAIPQRQRSESNQKRNLISQVGAIIETQGQSNQQIIAKEIEEKLFAAQYKAQKGNIINSAFKSSSDLLKMNSTNEQDSNMVSKSGRKLYNNENVTSHQNKTSNQIFSTFSSRLEQSEVSNPFLRVYSKVNNYQERPQSQIKPTRDKVDDYLDQIQDNKNANMSYCNETKRNSRFYGKQAASNNMSRTTKSNISSEPVSPKQQNKFQLIPKRVESQASLKLMSENQHQTFSFTDHGPQERVLTTSKQDSNRLVEQFVKLSPKGSKYSQSGGQYDSSSHNMSRHSKERRVTQNDQLRQWEKVLNEKKPKTRKFKMNIHQSLLDNPYTPEERSTYHKSLISKKENFSVQSQIKDQLNKVGTLSQIYANLKNQSNYKSGISSITVSGIKKVQSGYMTHTRSSKNKLNLK
ncbi:UNKNOWN [Stylonychia lemnae]|uniref:Uncharacterized protein n=1 Tax=Stylonychia lemnae TaxID=5949 RepID=A0A078B7I8_STYLE|nr:UNKNOWN [Stylonychia lemnae]|eukprot:CDW90186.1 UNKNOWN [Stylonychia lemnae]